MSQKIFQKVKSIRTVSNRLEQEIVCLQNNKNLRFLFRVSSNKQNKIVIKVPQTSQKSVMNLISVSFLQFQFLEFNSSSYKCNKQMNVLSLQRQQQIRTINFQQFVSGFTVNNRQNLKQSRASTPSLSQPLKRPQTSYHKKIVTANIHPYSGRRRIQLSSLRQHEIAVSQDKKEITRPQYQEQFAQGEEQIKNQQSKHNQFVKSYHQWIKETKMEEYQSSRMVNTFALKKTRASLRPKKTTQVFQFKAYQQHFNQDYHPPNLFPSRTHQSLKKMHPKPSEQKASKKMKNRNEGELKLQIMKTIAKKDTIKHSKVRKSHNIRSSDKNDKNNSLFMRTFSNPKLLAIRNGQLVTGTKILFIN